MWENGDGRKKSGRGSFQLKVYAERECKKKQTKKSLIGEKETEKKLV